MLTIRLTRVGKKNSPAFRVVVADQRKAVKRKFIEILGHYNPTTKPKTLVINKDRALHWIGLGAQASDTVNNLMVDLGILEKGKKRNIVYAKKSEVAAEKEAAPSETSKEVVSEGDAAEAETASEEPTEEAAETEAETVEETVEEK